MTAISAHRAGESPERCAAATAAGADYVEIDVRRTRDGELVAHHDEGVRGDPLDRMSYRELCLAAGRDVPRLRDVLVAVAGRARAHIDLKGHGYERSTVAMATEILDAASIVVTTRTPGSIAAVKRDFAEVRAALSLGRHWYRPGTIQDFFPFGLVRACGADLVAINYRLARLGVLDRCARRGLPAMIWTVNADPLLRRFLADPRVAVLITDRPRHAIALRDGA